MDVTVSPLWTGGRPPLAASVGRPCKPAFGLGDVPADLRDQAFGLGDVPAALGPPGLWLLLLVRWLLGNTLTKCAGNPYESSINQEMHAESRRRMPHDSLLTSLQERPAPVGHAARVTAGRTTGCTVVTPLVASFPPFKTSTHWRLVLKWPFYRHSVMR